MAPSLKPEHGPALVYISSPALNGTHAIARVDLNAVETPRERALCRALLHHALALLDDAENPLHTLTHDVVALEDGA
ncbi:MULTISPECIES: hypothetical protein [Streptomyces rochei group]|uniref:hypothetical protein n=1 Tax=Streptomyces rochei group TaxID=2867164 RepID=UPI00187665FD|nr:hypothetical protein [Streptomyces vinaceusdrappus]GHC36861.1 hypothetical protein GCM10010308_64190 [Streptomyces vinaceusdrappus]